jgi:hypothetical protein
VQCANAAHADMVANQMDMSSCGEGLQLLQLALKHEPQHVTERRRTLQEKFDLAQQELEALSSVIAAAKTKHARAEANLVPFIQHAAKLALSKIYSDVATKLPRELRDVVGSHVVNFFEDIDFWGLDVDHSFFKGGDREYSLDPWYFDPRLIGADMAREMVELLYRTGTFRIKDNSLLERLLIEDRWKMDIIPKFNIRNVQFEILDDMDYEDDARQARLFEDLGRLLCLNQGATIRIDFNLLEAWQNQQTTTHIDAETQGERIKHAERRKIFKVLLENSLNVLLPVLATLHEYGHNIRLEDNNSGWKHDLKKDGLSKGCILEKWEKYVERVLVGEEYLYEDEEEEDEDDW